MNHYENILRGNFNLLQLNDDYLEQKNLQTAIYRDDFPGFKEDYMAIHLIIKKFKPQTLMEIGTNSGYGTNIICNAMEGRKVFSIDLPADYQMEKIYSKVNPEDGRPSNVGIMCKFPFTQLWGNSKEFDFSKFYPIDAWFIDGKHNYEYASADTKNAMLSKPSVIIWHDININEVQQGVIESLNHTEYSLYYVENTRVAFAKRK